jgi:hypothetical protein
VPRLGLDDGFPLIVIGVRVAEALGDGNGFVDGHGRTGLVASCRGFATTREAERKSRVCFQVGNEVRKSTAGAIRCEAV